MAQQIRKCVIVSGAPNTDNAFLKENIDKSAYIIAADSGYLKLLEFGMKPNVIVADFDSSEMPDIDCETITFPIEKAYTDTFNSVILANERGYNDITIYFAIGSRFDHSYSNVLCLDYCKKNNIKCTIVDGKNRISLITDKAVIKKEYEYFSLFAFLENCRGVRIKGAHYNEGFFNKDSLDINPGYQFAQSNHIENDECEITLESGTLLLVESND